MMRVVTALVQNAFPETTQKSCDRPIMSRNHNRLDRFINTCDRFVLLAAPIAIVQIKTVMELFHKKYGKLWKMSKMGHLYFNVTAKRQIQLAPEFFY